MAQIEISSFQFGDNEYIFKDAEARSSGGGGSAAVDMFEVGDTAHLPGYSLYPAYVWSNRKTYHMVVYLGKPVSDQVTSLTFDGGFGLIDYAGYTHTSGNIAFSSLGSAMTYEIGYDTGIIHIRLDYSSSRSVGTANAGVAVMYITSAGLDITFN